jgi:co-chaperonin GroES (HSP10)
MKLNVFGNRVAVSPVTEKTTGKIVLPENRHKMYLLGKVEKANQAEDQTVCYPGNLVLFQTNSTSEPVVISGEKVSFLHPGDVIGILKSEVISIENFQIAGNWIMVEPVKSIQEGKILLPENVEHCFKFSVFQVGSTVKIGVSPGDEIVLERNRLTPIQIEGREFGYIDQAFVFGKIG